MTAVADKIQQIEWVSPGKVVVLEASNPRTTMDPDLYEELKASIKADGVFTPLLVTALDDDTYQLVAGNRRHTVALELDLDQVPVSVIDPKADTFSLAVAENLQREDFTLADEARIVARLMSVKGATQKKVAKLLHKSEPWVANRATIGELSEEAMSIVSKNILPAGHLEYLIRKMVGHPELLEQTLKVIQYQVEALEQGLDSYDEFKNGFIYYLDMTTDAEQGGDDTFFLVNAYAHQRFDAFDTGDAGVDALMEETRKIRTYTTIQKHLYLGEANIDAARAFGALVELEVPGYNGSTQKHNYIVDREWWNGMVKSRDSDLSKAIKQEQKDASAKPTTGAAAKGDAGEEPISKEEKAKARDKANKLVWKANKANHDVWVAGLQNLGKIKVTASKEIADYLIGNLDWRYWTEMDKAMVLLDPQYTVEGGSKPKYNLDTDKVAGVARAWVDKAKKPDEKLQRFIALRVMTYCVDVNAIAQARRPNTYVGNEVAAVLRAAGDKVLTPAMLKRIK